MKNSNNIIKTNFRKFNIFISFLFTMSVLNGCLDPHDKIDPVIEEPDNGNATTLDLNFYMPGETYEEINVPQLTLKNDEVQITAIGNNSNGKQENINKIYLSDKETQTEWIVLLDEARPKFLYAINTATQDKLPYLYWLEKENASKYTLRYYEYDWVNRLGTLQYEAVVDNDEININFENTVTQSNQRISQKSGLKSEVSKSFPAPIIEFEKYRNRSNPKNQVSRTNQESLDQQFDRKVTELMDVLKETKRKLINTPCNVSKILNKSDKNFICKLSDQLNKVTDEGIFNDLSQASNETQTSDRFQFEGLNIIFDIDFFDNLDVRNNLERHLNNVRNIFNEITDFNEWATILEEFNNVQEEDLNDLSDANGVLQIGLSWNSTSDIDLHVTDPFGEEINFMNTFSASGGYLDRDDIDGFGPENIYWTENIPDGTYKVSVVYFGPQDGPFTDYTVKVINGLGVEEVFSGSVGYFNHNKVSVVTFTKSGKVLSF